MRNLSGYLSLLLRSIKQDGDGRREDSDDCYGRKLVL